MSELIKDKKRMSVAERREMRKKKVERLDDGGFTFPSEKEVEERRKKVKDEAMRNDKPMVDYSKVLDAPYIDKSIKGFKPKYDPDKIGRIDPDWKPVDYSSKALSDNIVGLGGKKPDPYERSIKKYIDEHPIKLVDENGNVIPPKKRLYTYKGVTKEVTDKQIERIKNRALAWGESEFRKNPKRLERYKAQLNLYIDTLKSGEADLNVIGAEAERNLFDRITNPEEYAGYIFSQAINEGFGYKSDGSKSDSMIEAELKAAAEEAKTNANLFTERLISNIYKGNKSNYDADLKYLEGDDLKGYTIGLDDRMQKVADTIRTFEGYGDFALDGTDADANYKKIMDASRALGLTTADVRNYLTPTKPKSKSNDDTSTTSTSFTAISNGLNPDWAQNLGEGVSFADDNPEWTKSQNSSLRYGKVKDSNGTEKWIAFLQGENGLWGYSSSCADSKTILKREGDSILYTDENGNIKYIDNYKDKNVTVPTYLSNKLWSSGTSQSTALIMPESGVWDNTTAEINGKSIDLSSVVSNSKYAIYPVEGDTNMYRIITYDSSKKGTIVADKVIYTDSAGTLKIGSVTHNPNGTDTITDELGKVIKDEFLLGIDSSPIQSSSDAAPVVPNNLKANGTGSYKLFPKDKSLGLLENFLDGLILSDSVMEKYFPNLHSDPDMEKKFVKTDLRKKYTLSDDKISNQLYWGYLDEDAKKVANVNSSLADINSELDATHVRKLGEWLADHSESGNGAKLREMAQYELLYLRHIVSQYVKLVNSSDTDHITRLNSIIGHLNDLTLAYNSNPNSNIDKLEALPTLTPKFADDTNESLLTPAEKQGGTIRHLQDGGNVGLDEDTIARLNALTEKANKEYEAKKAKNEAERKEREAWLADPKNKPKFRVGGDENKGNQGSWGLRETGLAVATGLDAISMVGGPVGFAASLASTAIDAVADFTDDSLTTQEKWIRFGTNLAFTGLAAVPMLKALKLAAKAGKVAKGVDTAMDLNKAATALRNDKSLAKAVADRANLIAGSNLTAAQTGEVLRKASTFWSSAWRGVKDTGSAIGNGLINTSKAVASNKLVNGAVNTAMWSPALFTAADAWNSVQNGDGVTMTQLRGIISPLAGWGVKRRLNSYHKNMSRTINKLLPSAEKPGNIKVKFARDGQTHEIEIPFSPNYKKSDYIKDAKEKLKFAEGEGLAGLKDANKAWKFWKWNDVTVDAESLKAARSAASSIGKGYDTAYLKSLMTDERLTSVQRTILGKFQKSGALSTDLINAIKNIEKQINSAAELVVQSKPKGFSGVFTTKDVDKVNLINDVKHGIGQIPLPTTAIDIHIPSRWKRPTLSGNEAISIKNVSYNKKGGSLSFEQRVYLKNLDALNRAAVNTTKTFIEDLKLLAKKAENAENGFRQERLLILKGLK